MLKAKPLILAAALVFLAADTAIAPPLAPAQSVEAAAPTLEPANCRELIALELQQAENPNWWKPVVLSALESNLGLPDEDAAATFRFQVRYAVPNFEMRLRLVSDGMSALAVARSSSLCQ